MPLKEYSRFPDFMTSSEIAYCIEEILASAFADSSISAIEVANALLEMIERQSNNYNEKMNESTTYRIQQFVVNSWSLSSPKLIDVLSTIIVNLNNQYHFLEGFNLIESALSADNSEIQQIAKETLAICLKNERYIQ